MKAAVLALALALPACGHAQEDTGLSADDILKSVLTDEAAQEAGLPHGFNLPDGAEIVLSMTSGRSMAVAFDGSHEDLTNHFLAEIDRLGFELMVQERDDGKTEFVVVHPSKLDGELTIKFSRTRKKGQWVFLFINILQ